MGGPDCEVSNFILYNFCINSVQTQVNRFLLFVQEGPHSAMEEEEFYDAVELGLDRLDQEEEFRARLKEIQTLSSGLPRQIHPLNCEIDRITMEQHHYAR